MSSGTAITNRGYLRTRFLSDSSSILQLLNTAGAWHIINIQWILDEWMTGYAEYRLWLSYITILLRVGSWIRRKVSVPFTKSGTLMVWLMSSHVAFIIAFCSKFLKCENYLAMKQMDSISSHSLRQFDEF